MRSGSVLLLLVTLAAGSGEEMPVGFFRGTLLRWEGTVTAGILSAKAASGNVFDCHFDKKTFIELEKWRVNVDKLVVGDPLEVLSERRVIDRGSGARECYIMSLEVLPPPKPVRPGKVKEVKAEIRPASPSVITGRTRMRSGSDTYAGIVTAVTDTTLTLRTRTGVETFRLRKDTRYLGEGLRMELRDVAVNQRVNVEASSVDGMLEAFQLVWGSLSVQ
jgi:hypothetical protein